MMPLADMQAPNLLYVLGIPAGFLLVGVIICYAVYRVLGRFLHD
jgi:hypothetical protein